MKRGHLERMDILGHEALLIALDEQSEFAGGVWGRDGSVRTDDRVALWILEGICLYQETGGDWEEGGLVVGYLEDEAE